MNQYTLAGCGAIVLWSSNVALIRHVTEQLGPLGGAAAIYTLASVFLILFVGAPKLSDFPRRYLVGGGVLFVVYELCLALSLAWANTRTQAIEMGVINYLWPCLTVLLSVILMRQKVSLWLYPALTVAFMGVVWTVGGENGVSWPHLVANIQTNPLSYFLAFSGAIIWAIYCNITKMHAQGKNGITWFFCATAATLWVGYAFSDAPPLTLSWANSPYVLFAGLAMGGGYGLWNMGILKGNLVFLATLSYFIPILSTFLSAILLSTPLTLAFWQGVVMVTLGSLASWWLTRTPLPEKAPKTASTH
ncbi:aromatic amino acid DMT transporter YddG [Salinivibrio sp. ES.052]|uniref:aromatic amino acid DMT transporter YddG n=1 Tax=Salinivibrio sp. ES.052 TaxID=1882823 RepID=UPI000928CAF3|nr:aromatic amino acid DMT transporter YddG [Salinivibrio sp. ES.052]SIO35322.1 Permease of the drug/metabolite transporter (DMT) superfamily [Salinivibrio sp. ES.052]